MELTELFHLGCGSFSLNVTGLIEATCGRTLFDGYRTFSRSGSYQWMSEQSGNAETRKSPGSNPVLLGRILGNVLPMWSEESGGRILVGCRHCGPDVYDSGLGIVPE